MKTHVIQLESNDDVVSVRDQMGWSKSSRILLVWPKRARILRRRLDLELLQRHAERLGAQLALVTRDVVTRELADDLSIPVYGSVREAQRNVWKDIPRRKTFERRQKPVDLAELRRVVEQVALPKLENTPGRVAVFTLGVLAILLLALFFLPGASIALEPAWKDQSIQVEVWANPDIPQANSSGGVPAQVYTVAVTAQGEIASSGSSTLPDAQAAGMVEFTNLSDQALEIPAGTRVNTPDSIYFETTQSVALAAKNGATARVAVRAVTGGMAGNVEAGAINAVSGLIGSQVTVTNPEPMQGGADSEAPSPTADDYSALRAQLLDDLADQAMQQLQDIAGEEVTLLPVTLEQTEILNETRVPAEDTPADALQLSIEAEYSVWGVQQADLKAVASLAMNAALPDGYRPLDGTVVVFTLTEPQREGGQSVRWTMQVGQRLRADWNPAMVRGLVLGKTPDEARAVLEEQLNLRADPVVTMQPSWWFRLPYLPFRISLEEN